MTLIRNPLSDFETMSLFQDLKLKRRKIDSRCSSDGESIADTSTSSPDRHAPVSPPSGKMLEVSRISPSPGYTCRPESRQNSPLNGMIGESPRRVATTDDEMTGDSESRPGSVVARIKEDAELFDGKDGGMLRPRSRDADEESEVNEPESGIDLSSSNSSTSSSTSVGTCFSVASAGVNNKSLIMVKMPMTKSPDNVIMSIGDFQKFDKHRYMKSEHVIRRDPGSDPAGSILAWNASVERNNNHDFSSMDERVSPERMVRNSGPKSDTSSTSSTGSSGSSGGLIGDQQIIGYHTLVSSPTRFWVSTASAAPSIIPTNCRINGVRPELIGGYNEMKPPAAVPQKPANNGLRTTPTVIMGEAGGVRTMVWSTPANESRTTPPMSPPQENHAQSHLNHQQQSGMSNGSWSQQSPGSMMAGTQTESGPPSPMMISRDGNHHMKPLGPQFHQQHRFHPPHNGLSAPLNMERLWAGDMSQLPPSQQISPQQMQALNLSASTSHPIPWQHFVKNASEGPNLSKHIGGNGAATNHTSVDEPMDEDEQPMICMICEDKATGLHYGIITCEGCKGFFKRTVQNRRVYTCVADGVCEITKAQRNRCQYCRFKKCLEQGMVLQAVREDRMPGGRNSGAVYNLYKVKYKKHKKTARTNGQVKLDKQIQQQHPSQQLPQQHQSQHQLHNNNNTNSMSLHHQSMQNSCSPPHTQLSPQHMQSQSQRQSPPQLQQQQHNHQSQQQQSESKYENRNNNSSGPASQSRSPPFAFNGTILKTALTNPSEVVYLRQRLENSVTSSRDRALSVETSFNMIQTLVDCDEFQDIATLRNLDDLLEHKSDLSEKLMQIGDSIVYKLVQWTKRLPFYLELPVEIHTRLLTNRWHELLVLTTSAYQAIHGTNFLSNCNALEGSDREFNDQVLNNLRTLQCCLTSMMGKPITLEQLRQDVGLMVEKITHVTQMFRQIKLKMEEYVCLKVITMLNPTKTGCNELDTIQERYMTCLKIYTEHTSPQQPNRYRELLMRLSEVQSAAGLLLDSKMFYVPFLLNSSIR